MNFDSNVMCEVSSPCLRATEEPLYTDCRDSHLCQGKTVSMPISVANKCRFYLFCRLDYGSMFPSGHLTRSRTYCCVYAHNTVVSGVTRSQHVTAASLLIVVLCPSPSTPYTVTRGWQLSSVVWVEFPRLSCARIRSVQRTAAVCFIFIYFFNRCPFL